MSGLTVNGFERKRLSDIKEEIEQKLRDELGASINLTPPSVFATLVGIFAEREDLLWQLAENVYNASYPDTAEGVSLDNVVAISGITRQAATKSTLSALYMKGTVGTVIPAGTVFSVSGNPQAKFSSDSAVTLVAGTDEVQTISFSGVPTAGSFRLNYEDEQTSLISFNATAAQIQSALNALTKLSGVTVTGSFSSNFVVTFAGDDGKLPQPLLTVSNNTLTNPNPVTVTITETTAGVPQGSSAVTAVDFGPTQALARTLTVIDNPISGLNSVINLVDATVGRNTETDLDLRKRRNESLQISGAATVEAIKSALRNVSGVNAAVVIENPTDVVDSGGRPPHSFEAVVSGGTDQNVAKKIWETKPAGIATHGSTTQTVIDSMGISHTIKFSRPSPVNIWVVVNVTTNSDFPNNGAAQIEDLILERAAERFGIGDDVIPIPTLISVLDEIAGITDATLFVGTAPNPTLDNPITIGVNQIADFDSSRITVNVT
jgi:uncharacterized phage protein gp47/JayE